MKQINRMIRQYKTIYDNINNNAICFELKGDAFNVLDFFHYWYNKPITISDNLDKQINEALSQLALCLYSDNYFVAAWFVPIFCFTTNGFFVFYSNDKKRLIVVNFGNSEFSIVQIVDRINALYASFSNNKIVQCECSQNDINEFYERLKTAEDFYITQHGNDTQELIDSFGDTISKESFRDFLKQRIIGHLHWNAEAMYPIKAPEITKTWREARLVKQIDLPGLDHCTKNVQDFFYMSAFIFEQYGIEGIVQADEGDTVIDAGAYIADTALYFSEKVGNAGKVYGFEPLLENVEYAQDNVIKNNRSNIEIVPMALSDKKQRLQFMNHFLGATFSQCDEIKTENLVDVAATTVDDFVKEHNLTIDFIKSDIEGGEMALLHGARETICRDKPKCGITVYHKQDDFITIPKFLKSLCPEYQFYFRSETEPVLFAINNRRK